MQSRCSTRPKVQRQAVPEDTDYTPSTFYTDLTPALPRIAGFAQNSVPKRARPPRYTPVTLFRVTCRPPRRGGPPPPARLREAPEGVARLPRRTPRAAVRPPEGDPRRRPGPADRTRPAADRPRRPQGELLRPVGQPGELRGRRPRLAGRREPHL